MPGYVLAQAECMPCLTYVQEAVAQAEQLKCYSCMYIDTH
jgi:hypothetical protein